MNPNKANALATSHQPLAAIQREQLKIVIVGHVDHGKSTLIGRLFYDTGSLPEGKYEQIKAGSERRGMPFEWGFLLDALQAERDQGITIDTTQIWFKTAKRDYCIIDAPGHKEFLKNMISGAASSEAAVLVIDAKEGVREQSRKHGYLLHLLGVSQIAVAVNKMDMVDYSEDRFREIEREYRAYLGSIGVTPTYIIPISAREGDNVASPHLTSPRKRGEEGGGNMPWYSGPTIVEALDQFQPRPQLVDLPLRLPVQDVYKFDERRIIAGRIESGKIKVGDELVFSPSNKTARVASLEWWPQHKGDEAQAGMSVGITLDEQIFVERGNVISHAQNAPMLTNIFRGKIFWLGKKPLAQGNRYKIKINTSVYNAEVKKIEQVVDTENLAHAAADKVEKNAVAEVVFRVRGVASIDPYANNSLTGRFVIVDGYDVAGGGIIDMEGFPDQRPKARVKSTNIHPYDFQIRPEHRALHNGHLGGVLWFTGLSGSGKSTLAKELQRRLFEKGYQVYVLDGDNIRHGLNADLDFSPEGRSENIRRVGEVAGLFSDAGVIVISAFISPYKSDRDRARVSGGKNFHTIYIKADLKTCEKRDVKGLYKKARQGEIKDFTGISAPFEEPENPDLVVDTAKQDVEESVAALMAYMEKHFVEPVQHLTKRTGDDAGADI